MKKILGLVLLFNLSNASAQNQCDDSKTRGGSTMVEQEQKRLNSVVLNVVNINYEEITISEDSLKDLIYLNCGDEVILNFGNFEVRTTITRITKRSIQLENFDSFYTIKL